MRFSEMSLCPTTGLPFPQLLQELRLPLRVSAQALCWCYGRGCALHLGALEELLGLQIWPYWPSFSYSHR